MIAGNLVGIRLPKIQKRCRKLPRKSNLWRYRKCLRKFNFNEIRSPRLSLASTQGIVSFHDVGKVLFHLSLSYL
jgi:hypothetical protein